MKTILGRSLAILLAVLLSISTIGILKAEVYPHRINIIIQIDSPKKTTYTSKNIPLNVEIKSYFESTQSNYTVISQTIYLNNYTTYDPVVLGTYFDDGTPKSYNSTLNLKEDGQYTTQVSVRYANVGVQDSIYFIIQTNSETPTPIPTPKPTPSIYPESFRFSSPNLINVNNKNTKWRENQYPKLRAEAKKLD